MSSAMKIAKGAARSNADMRHINGSYEAISAAREERDVYGYIRVRIVGRQSPPSHLAPASEREEVLRSC